MKMALLRFYKQNILLLKKMVLSIFWEKIIPLTIDALSYRQGFPPGYSMLNLMQCNLSSVIADMKLLTYADTFYRDVCVCVLEEGGRGIMVIFGDT